MSNKNIEFRNSINGFNKQDVVRYIEELTHEVKNNEELHKSKIEQLETDNSAFKEKLDDLSKKLDSKVAENDSLKTEIKENKNI